MSSKNHVTELEERCDELEARNTDLQAELAGLRRERKAAAQSMAGAVTFGTRLFVGKGLRQSFRAWLSAKSLRDPLPGDETADVLAAIVRRIVRVGWVGVLAGFLAAAVPSGFLLWQNLLIHDQLRQQAEQIRQQASDTQLVRKAQLLATIYEQECEEVESEGRSFEHYAEKTKPPHAEVVMKLCKPAAHPRARQEAVRAFAEMERVRPMPPRGQLDFVVDLRDANLFRLYLPEVNLSRADLNGADLREANLTMASLVEASLEKANLSGAGLIATDLTGADLSRANLNKAQIFSAKLLKARLNNADLSEASLGNSTLSEADLSNADLSDADLSSTIGLTQKQIDEALGDANTDLPKGLTRPRSWTEAQEP